jgi:hypothetical protein
MPSWCLSSPKFSLRKRYNAAPSSLTIGLIVGIDDEEDYLTQRQVECAQREAGGLQQTQLDSPLLSVLNESGRPAVRRWSFQKSGTGPFALFGHGS